MRRSLSDSISLNDPRVSKSAIAELQNIFQQVEAQKIPLKGRVYFKQIILKNTKLLLDLNKEIKDQTLAVTALINSNIMYIWDRFSSSTPNLYRDLLKLLPATQHDAQGEGK